MGVLAYPNIEALPIKPDLAVICTRACRVPAIVETLAQFGCKVAIIMASGMAQEFNEDGVSLLDWPCKMPSVTGCVFWGQTA